MVGWYIQKGPESDVVISSRVRLARNLRDIPFPHKMSDTQQEKVLSEIKNTVLKSKGSELKDFLFVDVQELTPIDRQAMVERHLIS